MSNRAKSMQNPGDVELHLAKLHRQRDWEPKKVHFAQPVKVQVYSKSSKAWEDALITEMSQDGQQVCVSWWKEDSRDHPHGQHINQQMCRKILHRESTELRSVAVVGKEVEVYSKASKAWKAGLVTEVPQDGQHVCVIWQEYPQMERFREYPHGQYVSQHTCRKTLRWDSTDLRTRAKSQGIDCGPPSIAQCDFDEKGPQSGGCFQGFEEIHPQMAVCFEELSGSSQESEVEKDPAAPRCFEEKPSSSEHRGSRQRTSMGCVYPPVGVAEEHYFEGKPSSSERRGSSQRTSTSSSLSSELCGPFAVRLGGNPCW